jgi:effector-binding domain-containing protein
MKTIKILFTILVIIIVGTLAWAFFLPSEIHIKQSTKIKAPVAVVFDQVNDLRNWNNWSPYKDSVLSSQFEGPIRGVGAKVLWTDNKEGRAVLTITESEQFKTIKTELKVPGQEKSAEMLFTFSQSGDSTEIVWERNIGGLSYPFGRFVGWMLERGYNHNLKQALQDLKDYIETYKSEPEYYGFEPQLTEYPGTFVLALDDSCGMDVISRHIEDNFNVIRSYAARVHIKPTGDPMIQWHEYRADQYAVFSCMIPYDTNDIPPKGKLYMREMPPAKVAVVQYIGPYDFSYYAWIALDNFRMFHNLKMAGDPWEEYVIGPRNETDSSKFVTNIYFPYTPYEEQ